MLTEALKAIVLASAVGSLLAPARALASPAKVYDPTEPDGFPGDAAEWWVKPGEAPGAVPAGGYEATAPDGNVPSSAEGSVSLAQSSPTYEATDPDGNVPRPGSEGAGPLLLSGQVSPGGTP